MWRAQAHDEESRLEAEKELKYKGTARVRLKWLHFRWNEPGELDDTNVERLKSIFRKECRRLDIRNHICAVVDQQHLDAAILVSGISAGALLAKPESGYPELVFPAGYQLECLHGRHRIQAGKEVLPPADKWWTVDLYLADIDRGLKTYLIEEYSNEGKPADGEIYRKIRQYHFQRNLSFERRWWNRLTAHGKRCLRQLFRHDELTAACDALLDITGLWGGWRNSTLHTIMAIKCDEESLRYLNHIKEVWETLLQRDKNAMHKVDQATVKALELKAPRLSTLDAKVLRGQVLGGEIFGAFSEQERVAIWGRLQAVDGLIPSLFTFFEDVKYLEACANCVKRLVSLSPRDTVSTALEKAFCDANQRADRAVIQVTESSFTSSPASLADRVDLGYRQLHAYAMRHYLQMPREPKGKELLARLMVNTDETVLRDFADLADRLGFGSPEITALKQCPKSTVARARSERSKPLLVTDGAGEIKKRRCGLPRVEDYVEDGEFLFVNHLHNEEEEQGEGITSFFVRKSVYFAFFGRSLPLTLDSIPRVSDRTDEDMNRSQDAHIPQERREQEQQRQELERQEQERLKQERLEQEQERQKQEQQRLELERQELERQEQEQQRQELERQEQEQQRLELERLEQEQQRLELERLEQERLEQERLEQEQQRQEQERQEQEQQRLELERQEQEQQRLKLERLEQKRLKQEQERQKQEQQRLELERLELERLELERLELERLELERLEQEQEQERQKQEILKRLEQERQEQERQEQESLDKERLERERLREKQKLIEQERLKKERLKKEEQERKEKEERERQEQEERERQEQEERGRQEQEERGRQEQEERERQEQEGRERQEYQSLEDQQRLQDQQRLEQEELLEEEELDQEETNQQTEQDVNRGETPANLPSTKKARKPETQLEKRSDNTKIRINFKFREEGFWKDASFLMIDPFDPSEVERVAKKKIREKIRLFDTELRMLTPQECYQAVMIDGTYTVLLIRESEIYIDDELQISAMDVRIDALSHQQHMLKRVATNDISQLHHVRKKHHGRVFI